MRSVYGAFNRRAYEVVVSVNLEETYSFDGLIVANLPGLSSDLDLAVSVKSVSD